MNFEQTYMTAIGNLNPGGYDDLSDDGIIHKIPDYEAPIPLTDLHEPISGLERYALESR